MSLLEELDHAIECGDAAQVESLLASGSIDVNAWLPRFRSPPLVVATWRGRTAIVEVLLNAGARIDDIDSNGETACHSVARTRKVDLLAVLLKHRPNLEIKDNFFHSTPLQTSLRAMSDGISLMLINAGASLDNVDHLCRFAATSTAAIQALLNRGVVVNRLRCGDNSTPLHFLTIRRPWLTELDATELDAIVNMLVNVCGVDVNARTSKGLTCLQRAASKGNRDAMRCFINAGADVNSLDMPLLYCALFHSKMSCKRVMMLIASGADCDARGFYGEMACRRLVTKPYRGALPALMAAGADLSTWNPKIIAAVTADRVEAARRAIAKARLDFVRHRALQVCIGLQSLRINALQMCEILQYACGAVAPLVAFHQWWKIATTVKHFH